MTRGRLAAIALAFPLLLLVGASLAVRAHYALDVPPALPDDARAAAVAPLRAALEGQGPARPGHPALDRPLAGPAIVSIWSRGDRRLRVEGRGPTAADALLEAARRIGESPVVQALDPESRAEARLQVDLVVARGPLSAEKGPLRTFGLLPGMDGIGVDVLGREIWLGADELILGRLLMGDRPFKFMEFSAGLDFARADAALASRAALGPGVYGGAERRYFRFRADSFVERPRAARAAPPLRLVRGIPPGPPVSRASLREAALLGARYLVDHIAPNGRYVYEVDLATGETSNPENIGHYSLPRHAGTTYYLAQVYGATREEWLRAPLETALATMVELALEGGCEGTTAAGQPFACVNDKGAPVSSLGSTALAVVALAEYRIVTGDARYDEVHRRMVNFILDQQKPTGDFVHLYRVRDRRKDLKTRLLYFDGEAALALIRSHHVFQDPQLVAATERALDNLVGFYDFFAGQFFFGEEHWTCIAAEAAWPHLKHDRYREFCSDYAAFLRDGQFREGETPGQEDLVGSYGVTPFFVPYNTPAGSRSEAMISAYLLTRHHGKPDEDIRLQNLAAMGYLLRQQIREEGAFWSPHERAVGALPASAIDKNVRIDFVQHACSAMLRAIELLPEGA